MCSEGYLFSCLLYMEEKQKGIAGAQERKGTEQPDGEEKNRTGRKGAITQVLQVSDMDQKEEGQTEGVVRCEKQEIIGAKGEKGGKGQSIPKGKQKTEEYPEKPQQIGHKTNSFLIVCPK